MSDAEMFGKIPVNPLLEELAPNGGVPEVALRGSPDPPGLPNTLGASSCMLFDIGSRRRLPAVVAGASTPRRVARALPVGIFLYLVSVGIVATATVGVFFGIGFFLLAQPTEAMIKNADTGEHGSGTKRRLLHILSNASSTYGDTATVPIEPQLPRSVATAVLPVVTPAPPAVRASHIGDAPASAAADQSVGKRSPVSEAHEVLADASPPAVPAVDPPPNSSAAVPAPAVASRLSSGQITELLARGDAFLRVGDVASARLFYERAADAGDWQAAIRMGATFDPAFLGRSGVRTVGEPAKAQSWYRHALDLGAPKTDRQVESPKTK